MEGVVVESLLILLLLVINGLFAMSELAVVSARKIRLKQAADAGDRGAKVAHQLAEAPNDFLATVQIGITLVGILAGAFGGASIAEQIAPTLARFAPLAPYAEGLALGLVVLAITYVSLVVGELVPKRLALNHAESIARVVARPLRGLSRLAAPAVWLLTTSANLLLRLLRVRPAADSHVTEDEIRAMIGQGRLTGHFHAAEEEMIGNVFRLADQPIVRLMTPRRDIVWIDVDSSAEALRDTLVAQARSRLLVCEGTLDHVLGLVRAKDLLTACLSGEKPNLRALLRKPLIVPETRPALRVLEAFRQTGTHLALIIDEYGGMRGLVTHHDLMEAIVGDIPQPGGAEEAAVSRRDDGSWWVDGGLPADELDELLEGSLAGEDESGRYHTLAGMILSHLGRIPTEGESFERAGYRFEIADMDGHRIDKVLIRAVPPPAG